MLPVSVRAEARRSFSLPPTHPTLVQQSSSITMYQGNTPCHVSSYASLMSPYDKERVVFLGSQVLGHLPIYWENRKDPGLREHRGREISDRSNMPHIAPNEGNLLNRGLILHHSEESGLDDMTATAVLFSSTTGDRRKRRLKHRTACAIASCVLILCCPTQNIVLGRLGMLHVGNAS